MTGGAAPRADPRRQAPRTKIVCTLGTPRAGGTRPQDAAAYVGDLVAAGMDVARVNLSHARGAAEFAAGRAPEYSVERALLAAVRAASDAAAGERHVAALLDLQGVKVRIRLAGGVQGTERRLAAGERLDVRVTRDRDGGADDVTCDGSPALAAAVARAVAERGPVEVAVGDGETILRCVSAAGDRLVLEAPEACAVLHGKGVTFRGLTLVGEPPLTAKDKTDLAVFALPALLAGDADFLALSFVQSADDVRALRRFADACEAWFRGGVAPSDPGDARLLASLSAAWPGAAAAWSRPLPRLRVVAKIETAEGVRNASRILAEADGVMVARGDLGLNEAPEDVPRHQKELLRAAAAAGKPSIVATQMLESMTTAAEPRRSEATDVFNAVLDGADALMLSGETAVGSRPRAAAETLVRIASAAERFRAGLRSVPAPAHGGSPSHFLAAQSVVAARAVGAAAIVAASRSGETARRVARHDPEVPVIAVVPDSMVARSLALDGAVRPVVAPAGTGEAAELRGIARAAGLGWIDPGARVVVVGSRPGDPPGETTTLSVR